MNIKEAKEQIKYAVKSYLTRDEFGDFEIPIERQRPIFLMGPPGIGKTAVMEQVASELGVGIVSYSMTHHTRQSALGLPFISHKTYGGKEYDISEYTMSEIIASVYDMIEEDGVKEGILFLDEINCVSETLAPSMLQFLQYKIFGRHRVPDGWIVVTAGNPPEYNNSVREFDIVTWDRLKRIDIEPDYTAWKEYAVQKGIHAAVTTYLDIKKKDFYIVESSVDGKRFVTARGWVDLSDMIKLYEKNGFKVDETLVSQYLQNPKTAKDFAIYYDLFNKYRSDYQIDDILDGKADESIKDRAMAAKFDERLALIGLLLEKASGEIRDYYNLNRALVFLMGGLKKLKKDITAAKGDEADGILADYIAGVEKETSSGKHSGVLSAEDIHARKRAVKFLNEIVLQLKKDVPDTGKKAFEAIRKVFNAKTAELEKMGDATKKHMENLFAFCEEAFGDGQELLILITELTLSHENAHFVNEHEISAFFKYNQEFMFYERQVQLIDKIGDLSLDE